MGVNHDGTRIGGASYAQQSDIAEWPGGLECEAPATHRRSTVQVDNGLFCGNHRGLRRLDNGLDGDQFEATI